LLCQSSFAIALHDQSKFSWKAVFEGAGVALKVATAQTPEEKAKAAFVGGAGIWGGRIGTLVSMPIAFAEETGAPIVSTPVAIATVAAGNMAGSYVFEKFATGVWDAGEYVEDGAKRWIFSR